MKTQLLKPAQGNVLWLYAAPSGSERYILKIELQHPEISKRDVIYSVKRV